MPKSATKVLIVGAGVIGLATACRLAESGYEVTVIDRSGAAGEGSSKANAGQLLFDRVGAMGSPGFLRSLPRTLFDPSQGVRVHGLLNPGNWRWVDRFLRECTANAWQENTARLLHLARASQEAFDDFRSRHEIHFEWRQPGKLVTYATSQALDAAQRAAEFQAGFGGRHEVLATKECLALEPALEGTSRPIAGAIYLPDAEVGDCNLCCREMARVLVEQLGARIIQDTAVTGFRQKDRRVVAVECGSQVIESDLFVVATGIDAPSLLRGCFAGRKPVTSVLGISLTYAIGATPPDLSVTDASGKFVMLRLGDRLRVCGNAIFASSLRARPADYRALSSKAQALMPEAANFAEPPMAWVGARPQTPDDMPMIGQAGAENLFVNAGHGSLGWTLAFGSAEALLQSIKQHSS